MQFYFWVCKLLIILYWVRFDCGINRKWKSFNEKSRARKRWDDKTMMRKTKCWMHNAHWPSKSRVRGKLERQDKTENTSWRERASSLVCYAFLYPSDVMTFHRGKSAGHVPLDRIIIVNPCGWLKKKNIEKRRKEQSAADALDALISGM